MYDRNTRNANKCVRAKDYLPAALFIASASSGRMSVAVRRHRKASPPTSILFREAGPYTFGVFEELVGAVHHALLL